MELSTIALIAIAIAWVLQFLYTSPKKPELHPLFLIFYALGSAIITFNSFQNESIMTALLNFAIFAIPVAILLKINK